MSGRVLYTQNSVFGLTDQESDFRGSHPGVYYKKLFLKISQIHKKISVFLLKKPATILKLGHTGVLTAHFANFL